MNKMEHYQMKPNHHMEEMRARDEAVAPNSNDISKTLIGTTRTIMNETYNTAIIGVNTGMALAVALAWNETAKKIIKQHVQIKNLTNYHIVYAAAVTMLAGLIFTLTQLFFKPSIKRTEVKPVIAVSV
jgi:hypothetical protein